MRCRIVFYDLAEKWEGVLDSSSPLSCREAAARLLEQKGRNPDVLRGVIFLVDHERRQADSPLADGELLQVHRLLGGG